MNKLNKEQKKSKKKVQALLFKVNRKAAYLVFGQISILLHQLQLVHEKFVFLNRSQKAS